MRAHLEKIGRHGMQMGVRLTIVLRLKAQRINPLGSLNAIALLTFIRSRAVICAQRLCAASRRADDPPLPGSYCGDVASSTVRLAWIGGARREANVSEDPRPIRVYDPIDFDDKWIRFAARDSAGPLIIRIGRLAWTKLQADPPDGYDADDRRDYALGMIEARAALRPVVATPDGRLLTIPTHDG